MKRWTRRERNDDPKAPELSDLAVQRQYGADKSKGVIHPLAKAVYGGLRLIWIASRCNVAPQRRHFGVGASNSTRGAVATKALCLVYNSQFVFPGLSLGLT